MGVAITRNEIPVNFETLGNEAMIVLDAFKNEETSATLGRVQTMELI